MAGGLRERPSREESVPERLQVATAYRLDRPKATRMIEARKPNTGRLDPCGERRGVPRVMRGKADELLPLSVFESRRRKPLRFFEPRNQR